MTDDPATQDEFIVKINSTDLLIDNEILMWKQTIWNWNNKHWIVFVCRVETPMSSTHGLFSHEERTLLKDAATAAESFYKCVSYFLPSKNTIQITICVLNSCYNTTWKATYLFNMVDNLWIRPFPTPSQTILIQPVLSTPEKWSLLFMKIIVFALYSSFYPSLMRPTL